VEKQKQIIREEAIEKMIKKLVGSVLAAGVLLSAVSVSASTELFPGVKSKKVTTELIEVKGATAKYLNYHKAIKDGYEPEGGFVYVPGLGGMGVHFVNVGLMDSKVEPKKPEVLLYEPTKLGYKLIGVEYTVPAEYAKEAPIIFGQKFDGPMDNHDGSPGQHYDLHVWVWENNPSGTFAQFNPNVTGK
jgi:hypothetical protein